MTTRSMYEEFELGIDFRRMHDYRMARTQRFMAEAGLDGMVLFGDDNSTYASGATRNYPAACSGFDISLLVSVVRPGDPFPLIHTPDLDNVPPWHPLGMALGIVYLETPRSIATFAQRVRDYLGGRPKRIGIDVVSPMVLDALRAALPGVEVVDANPVMWKARFVKNQDEIGCLKAALKIAEGAMQDVVEEIRPGVTENKLHGIYLKGICDRGADWSVYADVLTKYPLSHDEIPHLPKTSLPWRRVKKNRVLEAGDPLSLDAGALFHGYFSDFGRSWIVPPFDRSSHAFRRQQDLCRRWLETTEKMLSECRPGRSMADIHRVAGDETVPAPFSVHGMGLYLEPPTGGGQMTPERLKEEEEWVLEEGWVLNIEPYVWEEGIGGYRADETIVITRDGYEKISSFTHGPLAE